MLVDVGQPGSAVPVKIAGVPIKLGSTPGSIRQRAPMLGEHTEEILLATGYGKHEIESMRGAGAIR
ncbi:hypothetical protein D9M72_378920 [compost metagenome]